MTRTLLAATVDDVIAYLAYISEENSPGVSTAHTHLSAVAFHYRTHGLPSITEDVRVKV